MSFVKLEKEKYYHYLVNKTIPFWEKYSLDHEYGGYFTCLDREGKVFDTDKFMWLQARQVWMFSYLYGELEQNEKWLAIAKHGRDFLLKHGRDNEGNWYFSLDRKGNPLVAPYNIFSDCFAAMALGKYAQIANDKEALEVAKFTYNNILKRKSNPKGSYSKLVPGTRNLNNFSLPMILCNLSLELEGVVEKELMDKTIDAVMDEVMNDFLDQDKMLIRENILLEGGFSDSFDGRLVNPGHGIEAMWFVIDIARKRGDQQLIDKCIEVVLSTLNFAWDKNYGGILYFMDIEGNPPQQLEWDQKLWWVHLETMVALSKIYQLTKREDILEWYKKVSAWAWERFADHENGEWFGYLNRQGEVLLDLKGGKWKGCFHVPRALYQCYRVFEQLEKEENKK
jgi:N-acylglucosamine 2-epimerase